MDEKVTDLKKSKRKKTTQRFITNPKDWTAPKIQNDILEYLCNLIDSDELESRYPEYFAGYRTIRVHHDDIESIIKISSNKEVRAVSHAHFIVEMQSFYRLLFPTRYLGEAITVSMQKAISESLIKKLPNIDVEEISSFAWKSEDIISWKKLDFDPISPEKFAMIRDAEILDDDEVLLTPGTWEYFKRDLEIFAPTWASVINRCSNSLAVLAYFGQIFTRDAKNQQFLYMYGKGGDSKGAMDKAMQKIMGKNICHSENLPATESGKRFFPSKLEGKRLLIFPDLDPENIWTSLMKSLTGGDDIPAEKKGKDVRNVPNNLCTIMFSNFPPVIPDKPYAKRRIIYSFIEKFEGPEDKQFSAKLVEERKLFVSIAIAAYASMGESGTIVQDQSVYVKNDIDQNLTLDAFILDYFDVKPDARVLVSKFNEYCKLHHLAGSHIKIRDRIAKLHNIDMNPRVAKDENNRTSRFYYGIDLHKNFLSNRDAAVTKRT